MSVVDSILQGISSIGNRFGILIDRISIFFNSVVDILGYVGEIFKAIWFGLVSLLSSVGNLLAQIMSGDIVLNIMSAYDKIAFYIGGPATVFLGTLLMVAMLRIGIAFVFKIFRLNIDYHSLNNKNKFYESHARIEEMKNPRIK